MRTLTPAVLALALAAAPALGAPKRVLVTAPPPWPRLVQAALGRAVQVVRPPAGEVAAIVTARATGSLATVEVLDGADWEVLAHFTVKLPARGALKALPRPAVAQLQRALARTNRAPAPAPREPVADVEPAPPPAPDVVGPARPAPVARAVAPEEKPAARAAPPEERPVARAAAAEPKAPATTAQQTQPTPPREPMEAVRVSLGARTQQRSLTWTDDVNSVMPTYFIPFATAVTVDAEVRPFALAGGGALAGLGLTGTFEQVLGLSSLDRAGQRYATTVLRARAGAQYTLPVWRLELRAQAGWATQRFEFSPGGAGQTQLSLPGVRTSAARGGLGVDVRLVGTLWLGVGAAYQLVLASGQIGSAAWFPRARAGGADFTAALRVSPVRHVELKLSAEYQRFWYVLDVQPGDRLAVGGALDEYRSLQLSVAWVL